MRHHRRFMFDISFAACVLVAGLATVRCGSSDSSPTPATTGTPTPTPTPTSTSGTTTTSDTVTLQVTVSTFAFDTSAATLGADLLKLEFSDPNFAFNGNNALHDSNNIPTTNCTTASGVQTCTFSIADFDVSGLTHGLLLFTTDNRASTSSPMWKGVFTYVPQASITAAQTASGHTLAVRAAAVSDGGLGVIGSWGSGTSSTTYVSNGATLGVVQDSSGAGVSGVTVNAGSGYTVTYGSNDGTAQGSTSTGTDGLFLAASGTAASAANTDWTLTPATAGMTWDTSYTGSIKLALTVFFFTAK